ncbi:MAG: DUF1566 domain-containing protein, partial [Nitrospirae bacterium]|nr:DUF1566 domain-containing protein [Nitrospirota bacterium]
MVTRNNFLLIVGVCLLLMLQATPLMAMGAVNLPQTGQTVCYDSLGYTFDCAYPNGPSHPMQDGSDKAGMAWPGPRFTDNGDNTITDALTGLMWVKDPTQGAPSCGNTWTQWAAALDYINCIDHAPYLGHSDWRMPNIVELQSLAGAGTASPEAWLNTQGFTNVYGWYWSSTTLASNNQMVWDVYMYDGIVSTDSKLSNNYIWPVRGAQVSTSTNAATWRTGQTQSYHWGDDGADGAGVAWPSPRFTDNGNTVIDKLTGLMWTKNADMMGGTGTTWVIAYDFVQSMNIANTYGYNDWRLPNKEELFSLVDFSNSNPALPAGHPFTHVQWGYWSSTTMSPTANTSIAWVGSIADGHSSYISRQSLTPFAWPVRGGLVGNPVNLTISKSGTGTGTVASYSSYYGQNDGIINCGSKCSATYNQSITTILTATAGQGSIFSGWSGAGCSGKGTCTLTSSGPVTVTATFTARPTAHDFDGDGKSDILFRNSSTGDVAVWLMIGSTIKQSGYVFKSLDSNWQTAGVGDFDGDGNSDILFRNSSTGDVAIWLMNGTTIKQGGYTYTSLDSNWQIAGVGDFDGDGNSDILFRNLSTGDVAIWLM